MEEHSINVSEAKCDKLPCFRNPLLQLERQRLKNEILFNADLHHLADGVYRRYKIIKTFTTEHSHHSFLLSNIYTLYLLC